MSRTLIVPDIHNRYYIVQRIIESVEHDQIVCLGDYFDDFNEQLVDVVLSARMVRDLSTKPNTMLLLGNHDIAYFSAAANPITGPTRYTQCSGWTGEKHKLINEVMHGHWEQLRTHAFVDGWILSHAGFSPYFVGNDPIEAAAIIETDQHGFMQALRDGCWHPWLSVSRLRGGMDHMSGPFWQDWREFRSPAHTNQIVGHTPGLQPRKLESYDGSTSWCLDTHLNHYVVLKDGELDIYPVPSVWKKRPRSSGPRTRHTKLADSRLDA